MNLRDIEYAVMVSKTLHFGRAAELCFVSQPTLSAQLKKFEEELGVQLFERSNKKVIITSEGRVLVAKAQQVLNEVKGMKDLARHVGNPLSGVFRLGIIPTLGPYLLPLMIGEMRKSLPKLDLHVVENKTEHVLSELAEGNLDAIVLALPVDTAPNIVRNLFYEPFYVAMPEEHPLAVKREISIEDLEDEPILLLDEGHCLRGHALVACQGVAIKQRSGFSATSLETLRQLVSMGAGITLLPELAVRGKPKAGGVALRPFSRCSMGRGIGMVWRPETARLRCCEAIADIIYKVVKNKGGKK
jgi:LysR family hydrogen peroxide-inducible transcriptional activator